MVKPAGRAFAQNCKSPSRLSMLAVSRWSQPRSSSTWSSIRNSSNVHINFLFRLPTTVGQLLTVSRRMYSYSSASVVIASWSSYSSYSSASVVIASWSSYSSYSSASVVMPWLRQCFASSVMPWLRQCGSRAAGAGVLRPRRRRVGSIVPPPTLRLRASA